MLKLSHFVTLANKFSELVLIFENSAAAVNDTDGNAEVLREGSLKRMESLALEVCAETPSSEEEALQMLSVINHHLVANKIDPIVAKQARARATALITSEHAINAHMEIEIDQLQRMVESDLPNKEVLKARLKNVMEELARLKKNNSLH